MPVNDPLWTDEATEVLRPEFERRFGKDKETGAGEWLDLGRLVPGSTTGPYRSMVTEYAWRGFLAGRWAVQQRLGAAKSRLEWWLEDRMAGYTEQQYGKGALRALKESLDGQ